MGWFDFGNTEITDNIDISTSETSINYFEIKSVSAITTVVTYIVAKQIIKKCKKALEKKIITTVPPV
jgi:hypothetical protein